MFLPVHLGPGRGGAFAQVLLLAYTVSSGTCCLFGQGTWPALGTQITIAVTVFYVSTSCTGTAEHLVSVLEDPGVSFFQPSWRSRQEGSISVQRALWHLSTWGVPSTEQGRATCT